MPTHIDAGAFNSNNKEILVRVLAGLLGIFLLYLFYNSIFIEHKGFFIGGSGGYYGPLSSIGLLYLSIVLIAYAIDAQKFLRKIAPAFAENMIKMQSEQLSTSEQYLVPTTL